MKQLLGAGATTLVVILALDLLWLGVVARPWYQAGIGHLMAERPVLAAAVLFYLLFAVGLMVFAVTPDASGGGWRRAALAGAMFGFFAYATYDLTNLATLRGWPVWLSALDMAWGTLVGAVSAAAGRAMLDRLAAG
jgi:uncharacterized membrane protein